MSQLNKFGCIDDFLDAAVLENLCVDMGCTTCFAFFFRQKLVNYLSGKISDTRTSNSEGQCIRSLTREQVDALARDLGNISRGSLALHRPELHLRRKRAIDFLIRETWNNAHPETRDEWISEVLRGTLAGERYEAMLAHYKKDLRRRARVAQREEIEAHELALRKEDRARRKNERARERAIRKVEIDRLWRARQK